MGYGGTVLSKLNRGDYENNIDDPHHEGPGGSLKKEFSGDTVERVILILFTILFTICLWPVVLWLIKDD